MEANGHPPWPQVTHLGPPHLPCGPGLTFECTSDLAPALSHVPLVVVVVVWRRPV